MTDKEVMQSAMNEHCPACGYYCLGNGGVYCIDKPTTVETTRACLAEPEHYDQTELGLCKKCGWKAVWPDGCLVCEKQEAQPEKEFNPASEKMVCVKEDHKLPKNIPIVNLLHDEIMYAAPHKKEWVGLTDDDINDLWRTAMWNTEGTRLPIPEFARAIEAKLKEMNS